VILVGLIAIPAVAGLLAWSFARWARFMSILSLTAELLLLVALWIENPGGAAPGHPWIAELRVPWITELGVSFHLAMDGLSLLLSALTALLGLAAVAVSWSEIQDGVGFFHMNLLFVLAGVLGVFLALDLLLFAFFWELMLVPMYFLIAIWGHENRAYAAVKFFLFTQLSGLFMLLAILGLYFVHHRATGVYTFDYAALLGTPMSASTETWLMLGFFVAFAVKLPAVPVHTWLADAHTEAPTAGSVILAGLLLKTGAYGLLRFAVPLFPDAAHAFAPVARLLAVVGILYGAVLAFAQTDLKRLVAYTSVSHLGFVLLGIYAFNALAFQGVVLQMICHGLSTGGLFLLVGALDERLHSRDLGRMGGLWAVAPRAGGVGLFFALASLGLPGLGNFVAEFLVLLGSYRANVPLTAIATAGLVPATIYALEFVQKVFHGPNVGETAVADLRLREMCTFVPLIVALVWLGVYPKPVIELAGSPYPGASGALVRGGP
jgi:NADH-quinone oxidoreductase subunit M